MSHSPTIPVRLPRAESLLASSRSHVLVSGYRAEIDGLRAVAVLSVILFHAGFMPFPGGYVGVDVFFVISGYLITSIILEEKERGEFSLAGFYERRARRILPALFLVLLACMVPAWLWMMPLQLEEFSQGLMAVPLFSSNVLFWSNSAYFRQAAEENPLLHTWSLGVEEQFYFLLPLIVIALWRLGRPRLAATIGVLAFVSLAVSEYGARNHPVAAFFLAPTRGWELAVGALLAAFPQRLERGERPRSGLREILAIVGLALVVAPVFLYHKETPFPGFAAVPPVLGTALVIAFARRDTLAAKLLGLKLVVGVGLISYSAYLWHQPLFAFARVYFVNHPPVDLRLSLIAATLALAYLSWRFVELPFRDRTFLSRRTIAWAALGASTFFIAIGAVGYAGKGFEQRLSAEARLALAHAGEGMLEPQVRACTHRIANDPSGRNACRIGAPGEAPSVAIWGDSHARGLVSALDEALHDIGLAGTNLTFPDCPPVLEIVPERMAPLQETCGPFRQAAYDRIVRDDSIKTVILAARWSALMEGLPYDNGEGGVEYGDSTRWHPRDRKLERATGLANAIRHTVKGLIAADKNVILVYPIPEVAWNVPYYIAKASMDGPMDYDLSTSVERFRERSQSAYAALDSVEAQMNLVRVKPAQIFCDTFVKDRCVAQLRGVPLYVDDDHLTRESARWVIEKTKPHIRGADSAPASASRASDRAR